MVVVVDATADLTAVAVYWVQPGVRVYVEPHVVQVSGVPRLGDRPENRRKTEGGQKVQGQQYAELLALVRGYKAVRACQDDWDEEQPVVMWLVGDNQGALASLVGCHTPGHVPGRGRILRSMVRLGQPKVNICLGFVRSEVNPADGWARGFGEGCQFDMDKVNWQWASMPYAWVV
jgi:hypothetical protein